MSKAIKIGINFLTDFSDTVTKLRVNELGASTTNWVPEDEVQADALHVTANGEYSAATAGKYCYDYVTVSVPGNVVTGKDPTTGKEVSVTVDPETGELVEEVLPVEIRVTTPPALLQYTDGDTIDFTGIVVHAYDSDGEDLGAVPFGELVFPVTEAEYIETPGDGGTASIDSPLITANQPVLISSEVIITFHFENEEPYSFRFYSPNGILVLYTNSPLTRSPLAALWAFSKDGPPDIYMVDSRSGLSDKVSNVNYEQTTLVSGTTFYYSSGAPLTFNLQQHDLTEGVLYDMSLNEGDPEIQIGTILFDGTITGPKSVQDVPVQWPRTVDGAVLESSFNIYVTPAP